MKIDERRTTFEHNQSVASARRHLRAISDRKVRSERVDHLYPAILEIIQQCVRHNNWDSLRQKAVDLGGAATGCPVCDVFAAAASSNPNGSGVTEAPCRLCQGTPAWPIMNICPRVRLPSLAMRSAYMGIFGRK
jgi:hypothetical protein